MNHSVSSGVSDAGQAPMKILLVTDQFYAANNGMTISSRRFAAVLRAHGHEVRILSYGKPEDVEPGQTAYLLKKQYIPVFDKLVASQGMVFAKVDAGVVEEAVRWADVIHFLTPFALAHAGIRLARKYGVSIVKSLFKEKTYQKWEAWIGRQKYFPLALFMAILLPLFPDDFFCYFSGLTTMKPRRFIWIILIGKPWCILAYSLIFGGIL